MRHLIASMLAALVLTNSARTQELSEKVKQRAGEKAFQILKNATKVEVYRVNPRKEAKAEGKLIGGFKITATGKEQGKEFAAQLLEAVSQEKTWFGTQARCFLPGVAFRAVADKEAVEFIICFGCSNFVMNVVDGTGKVVHTASGAFGGNVGPLLKVTKAAFPEDKDIQELKEK